VIECVDQEDEAVTEGGVDCGGEIVASSRESFRAVGSWIGIFRLVVFESSLQDFDAKVREIGEAVGKEDL
jgi:hypothetical protein